MKKKKSLATVSIVTISVGIVIGLIYDLVIGMVAAGIFGLFLYYPYLKRSGKKTRTEYLQLPDGRIIYPPLSDQKTKLLC